MYNSVISISPVGILINEDIDSHLEYLQETRLTVNEWFYLQENCDYSY